jgi:hypothetical protein
MNRKNEFDPQISPIGADESGSRALATSLSSLRNLRHLRIEPRFLG